MTIALQEQSCALIFATLSDKKRFQSLVIRGNTYLYGNTIYLTITFALPSGTTKKIKGLFQPHKRKFVGMTMDCAACDFQGRGHGNHCWAYKVRLVEIWSRNPSLCRMHTQGTGNKDGVSGQWSHVGMVPAQVFPISLRKLSSSMGSQSEPHSRSKVNYKVYIFRLDNRILFSDH